MYLYQAGKSAIFRKKIRNFFLETARGYVFITYLGRVMTYILPSLIGKMREVKVDNISHKAVKGDFLNLRF